MPVNHPIQPIIVLLLQEDNFGETQHMVQYGTVQYKFAIAKRLRCAGRKMWLDSIFIWSFMAVSLKNVANMLQGKFNQHMIPPVTGAG